MLIGCRDSIGAKRSLEGDVCRKKEWLFMADCRRILSRDDGLVKSPILSVRNEENTWSDSVRFGGQMR